MAKLIHREKYKPGVARALEERGITTLAEIKDRINELSEQKAIQEYFYGKVPAFNAVYSLMLNSRETSPFSATFRDSYSPVAHLLSLALGVSEEELFGAPPLLYINRKTSGKDEKERIALSIIFSQIAPPEPSTPEESLAFAEFAQQLDAAIEKLPSRLQYVIKERFFEDSTLENIAKELGVSRERVRQNEARALRELKHPSKLNKLVAAWGEGPKPRTRTKSQTHLPGLEPLSFYSPTSARWYHEEWLEERGITPPSADPD